MLLDSDSDLYREVRCKPGQPAITAPPPGVRTTAVGSVGRQGRSAVLVEAAAGLLAQQSAFDHPQ